MLHNARAVGVGLLEELLMFFVNLSSQQVYGDWDLGAFCVLQACLLTRVRCCYQKKPTLH
jgi:hypothetical protein